MTHETEILMLDLFAEQVAEDMEAGDYTALEMALGKLTTEDILNFLSEDRADALKQTLSEGQL